MENRQKTGTRVKTQVVQIKICSNHNSGSRVGPLRNREKFSLKNILMKMAAHIALMWLLSRR